MCILEKIFLIFLLYEIIMFKLNITELNFYLDLIRWNLGSIWKKSLDLIQ